MQRLHQIIFTLALPFVVGVALTQGQVQRPAQHARSGAEMQRQVRTTSVESRADEVQFFDFQFLRPYLGYEGPNFTQLEDEPSAGAQYLVTAELFRQEAVSTAKFELVDEKGDVIQPLHFFKQDNSISSGDFLGCVKVPGRPFRVAVSGMGIDGKPYRSIYKHLFRPTTRPPLPPMLPRRMAPADAKRIAGELVALEKRALAECEQRAGKQPDRVIVMPRVAISNVTYDSFLSKNGNRLGMQLTYDVRFSVDGDYAHSLQVFPFYKDDNVRGLVEMTVISEEITPRPGPPSYATPNIHVDLNTLVKYGSHAWYKAGVVYRFTVKLVPDFVGQNANKTKFCLDEEHYKTKVKSLRGWQTMKEDPLPVQYRIFINEVAYSGETDPFDPPKTYYDGFLREGAVKCKPNKNIYF